MNRLAFAVIIATIAAAGSGCSVFVRAPENVQTGEKVVCILYNHSDFKDAVVDKVAADMKQEGYAVITDRVKRARHYSSADFGAVVYISDYWARRTPRHAIRYFDRNKKSRNTLFVVTSGDPDVTIKEPFDAVTTASKQERVAPVAAEITEKLGRILR